MFKATRKRNIRAFTLVEACAATVLLSLAGVVLIQSMMSIKTFNAVNANQGIALRKLNNAVNYYTATGSQNYATNDPTGYSLYSPNFTYTNTVTTATMPYIEKSEWQQQFNVANTSVTNNVILAIPVD